MSKRFVTIWFRYLQTDWWSIQNPFLRSHPFVLTASEHNRIVITEANAIARQKGVFAGMTVADARVAEPALQSATSKEGIVPKLLQGIAEWCIRYSPVVAVHPPDCIIIDATGCTHLWEGEEKYLHDIISRLKGLGYNVHAAIADTIGAAWAISRFEKECIVLTGKQSTIIFALPPSALRIETEITDRLYKLGLKKIGDFINMPRSVLHRRFGPTLLQRLDQALGTVEEFITPIIITEGYEERLPCLEPIISLTGIEIATEHLLHKLCARLLAEEKGLRHAILKCYRVDGKIEKIEISTNQVSNNSKHLFKLFNLKFQMIEPALGIEFFLLEATGIEKISIVQEKLWSHSGGLQNNKTAELLDRIAIRIGAQQIHRYIPDEHHWPERSFKKATSLQEKPATTWQKNLRRPIHFLKNPEPLSVTAPIPDYPPMLFRYKGNIHKIKKADGPERIEPEWWLQDDMHRDYFIVEDEKGNRYWIFRLGHYSENKNPQWFLHGFFP